MPDYKSVLEIISSAGVIAVPTDTVWGLAVDPSNHLAMQKLYRLKGRDAGKPLVWMVADISLIPDLIIDSQATELMKRWPGALTIIFRRADNTTLGVRIPGHPWLIGLLQAWGKPLAVTSANLSGEPECVNRTHVEKLFGKHLDFYGPESDLSGQASTVVDISSGVRKILRQGELRL